MPDSNTSRHNSGNSCNIPQLTSHTHYLTRFVSFDSSLTDVGACRFPCSPGGLKSFVKSSCWGRLFSLEEFANKRMRVGSGKGITVYDGPLPNDLKTLTAVIWPSCWAPLPEYKISWDTKSQGIFRTSFYTNEHIKHYFDLIGVDCLGWREI